MVREFLAATHHFQPPAGRWTNLEVIGGTDLSGYRGCCYISQYIGISFTLIHCVEIKEEFKYTRGLVSTEKQIQY